jgi:hypothetical protein
MRTHNTTDLSHQGIPITIWADAEDEADLQQVREYLTKCLKKPTNLFNTPCEAIQVDTFGFLIPRTVNNTWMYIPVYEAQAVLALGCIYAMTGHEELIMVDAFTGEVVEGYTR